MNFSINLLSWYQNNKRDLPWRNTVNAYYIWLSEIILQQTRVEQGMPYYLAFVNEFPKVEDLAKASEDKVLKMWQGLGYYSRARNLHFTAKDIVENHNALFPEDYNEILKFKGIGTYTAAAISSFAFGLPFAVVDGNVIRVLSRVFGIDTPYDTTLGKKEFQKLAQELLITDEAATYNQAIMEFGAMQCKPKSPNCTICPMQDFCEAFNASKIDQFPVKSKKIIVKDRFLHFFMINKKEHVYLGKRDNGIWKGLYEFPFIEVKRQMGKKELINTSEWETLIDADDVEIVSVSGEYIHKLSHQKLHVVFWNLKSTEITLPEYELVAKNTLLSYPVSRLMEKYFETLVIA